MLSDDNDLLIKITEIFNREQYNRQLVVNHGCARQAPIGRHAQPRPGPGRCEKRHKYLEDTTRDG